MKAYLKSKKQKLVILSVAAAILVGIGINCSKLNRFDFDIGGVNWNQNDTIEFEHIWKERNLHAGNIPQQNLVIKNQTEWNALLNVVDSGMKGFANAFANYPIDFSQHQIIAIFDEFRGGEWGIEVANIVEQTCHIVVTYHAWQKEGNADSSQAFHLVKISASNKQIMFQEEFEKEEEENVPYASCSLSGDTFFLRGTAYLFRDSISVGQQIMKFVMNIIYNTQDSSTHFSANYYGSSSILYAPSPYNYYGSVCNFPDFAKQWNIPPEGKQVYYKGKIYVNKIYAGPDGPAPGELELTILKDTLNQ